MPDYWVKGTFPHVDGDRVLHTDEDCPWLQRARNKRPAYTGEVEDMDECTHCTEQPDPADPDRSHYNALREAAKQ